MSPSSRYAQLAAMAAAVVLVLVAEHRRRRHNERVWRAAGDAIARLRAVEAQAWADTYGELADVR